MILSSGFPENKFYSYSKSKDGLNDTLYLPIFLVLYL
nr:MAG TPA: hypothetical protein [Bacteriophage sp.]